MNTLFDRGLDWFPSHDRSLRLHPLPAMWLTPLNSLSVVPPLSKRARTRFLSDDVEMEGNTPNVFPGDGAPGPAAADATAVPMAVTVVPATATAAEEDYGLPDSPTRKMRGAGAAPTRGATPTPPVSPLVSGSRGSDTTPIPAPNPGPVGRHTAKPALVGPPPGSPQRAACQPQQLSPRWEKAAAATENMFPKSSGLLKAALTPTPPGSPRRGRGAVLGGRKAPLPTAAAALAQPPLETPGSGASRAMSPLMPRVWSGGTSPTVTATATATSTTAAAKKKDPLAGWGYTNPKPVSPIPPGSGGGRCAMDISAFPTGACARPEVLEPAMRGAVADRCTVAALVAIPGPEPLRRTGRRSRSGSMTAAAVQPPPPAALRMMPKATELANCYHPAAPVFGKPMSPVQRARAKLMLEGGVRYGEPVVEHRRPDPPQQQRQWQQQHLSPAMEEQDEETDPESEIDMSPEPPTGATALCDVLESSPSGLSLELPGLVIGASFGASSQQQQQYDSGGAVKAGGTAMTTSKLGLGMFDWDYQLATAPDNVPRVPDIAQVPSDYGATNYGANNYGARTHIHSSLPLAYGGGGGGWALSQSQDQAQANSRPTGSEYAAVTYGIMVESDIDVGVEEYSWGSKCKHTHAVPDVGGGGADDDNTGHFSITIPDTPMLLQQQAPLYTDHYSVGTPTSLGWDGCFYGAMGSGSSAVNTVPDGRMVRSDSDHSMGVIYDLV